MTAARAIDEPIRPLLRLLRDGITGEVETTGIEQEFLAFLAEAANELRGRSPLERKRFRDRSLALLEPLVETGSVLESVRRRGSQGARGHETLLRALSNEPAGNTVAAMAFDRIIMNSNALSALRTRRLFFRRELRYRFAHSAVDRPFRVLAFGAGPRSEVLQFLGSLGPGAARVEATLLDSDPECLASARAAAERGGFSASLRTHHEDPVRASLLGAADGLTDQDFIFSPGLLDFIPDELATRCLDFAFSLLRPSGLMALAHYHSDLTSVDRLLMEWWLEWFPYFRTPRQLARLIRCSPAQLEGVAVGLIRGPNVYVVVDRR